MFLVAGIAGGALVGLSDDVYDFQQSWLSVGGAVWMLVLVLTAAVYPPSWLRLFTVGENRKQMLGGILHLSLAVDAGADDVEVRRLIQDSPAG